MALGQHLFGVVTNSSGAPTSGASINVHPAGALTALTIYSDAALTTTKTNPFTVNSDGTWEFYVAKGQTIRVRVTQSGATTRDIDNIYLPGEVDTATLTNQTGITLAAGDVVGLGTGSASSVVIDDTLASLRKYVVALQAPAQGATGLFASGGLQASVKAQGAIPLGDYIRKSATARAVEDTGTLMNATNTPPQGAIGVALNTASGGTVDVWLFKDPVFIPTTTGSWSVIGQTSVNNAGTPNTQWDMDADVVVVRSSTDATVVRFNPGAALTCNISTAGPAANGRDQAGAFSASTFVHFYWIWNGTTLATLASASGPTTGPTLPTGYTHWAYGGAVFLDATSALRRTRILGDKAWFDAQVRLITDGRQVAETAIGLTTVSPSNGLDVTVHVRCYQARSNQYMIFRTVTGSDFWNSQGGAYVQASSLDLQLTIPNVAQNLYYLWSVDPGATFGLYLDAAGYRVPILG